MRTTRSSAFGLYTQAGAIWIFILIAMLMMALLRVIVNMARLGMLV